VPNDIFTDIDKLAESKIEELRF